MAHATVPGAHVSETQCSLWKFSGWSQCFLSWRSQFTAPQWKVLDSSSALVWKNTHPTLSLLRHWCSMWKIKSVAHSSLSPPSPYSNINMYDRVWWRWERLREIENSEARKRRIQKKMQWETLVQCFCGQIQGTALFWFALKCNLF